MKDSALPPVTEGLPPAQLPPDSLAAQLFADPTIFSFFQAMRLLERWQPERQPVAQAGPPSAEIVRIRAHQSLGFPASQIFDLQLSAGAKPPVLTVTFFGLTGPSGILPRHYTELLLKLYKETKGPERTTLRDWLDLFNHRLISLFYKAWEKYRFFLPYERRDYARRDPDSFTSAMFSLIGLGTPGLRKRLRLCYWDAHLSRTCLLDQVNDLGLLFYGGLLAHRPRNAVSLQAMLGDYFQLPVNVHQFQGQWLLLEPANQSRLGNGALFNNQLGVNMVAGERVWDVQGKVRIRLGPLSYDQFLEFLPDRSLQPGRKALFMLLHLVRFYVGPELSFDVQVILQAAGVPECCLAMADGIGPRLGWNIWLKSQTATRPAEDAVFDGHDQVWLNEEEYRAAFK